MLPDAIACWRNRQAEIEFHIFRHEWFLGKSPVRNPEAIQRKIDAYRMEWAGYERLIQGVRTIQTAKSRSAA